MQLPKHERAGLFSRFLSAHMEQLVGALRSAQELRQIRNRLRAVDGS